LNVDRMRLKILFLRIDSSIRICKNSETYSVFKN
jgi:hypothetical protein